MYTARFLAVQVIMLGSLLANAAFHSVRMGGRSVTEANTIEASNDSSGKRLSHTSNVAYGHRRSFKLVSEKELRHYVHQNVSNIKQVVQSSRYTVKQKLDFIQTTTKAVANFRAQSWSKSAFAEIEMDLSIKPFESFPDSANFKAQKCHLYEDHLLLEWEPGALDARPAQRGVSEALSVLRQICRG